MEKNSEEEKHHRNNANKSKPQRCEHRKLSRSEEDDDGNE